MSEEKIDLNAATVGYVLEGGDWKCAYRENATGHVWVDGGRYGWQSVSGELASTFASRW